MVADMLFARLEVDSSEAWSVEESTTAGDIRLVEATVVIAVKLLAKEATEVLASTPVEVAVLDVAAGLSFVRSVWLVLVASTVVWIVVATRTVVIPSLVEVTVVAAGSSLARLLAASLPEISAYRRLKAKTRFNGTPTSVAFPKTTELFS